MTAWVDLLVYASLIVAFWFLLPAWSARFTLVTVSDRNPDWLREHPEVSKRLSAPRRFLWVYHGWGVVSLATLFAFQVDLWPGRWSPEALQMARWETLKELNTLLLLPGLLVFAAAGVLFTRWLTATVPLADRRAATLERRTLDDFVPRPAQFAVYAVIAGHLIAWLAAAAFVSTTTPKFWWRLLFIVALTPIVLVFPRWSVRRPPQTLDRLFGPAYRRTEVRYGLAANLVVPIAGAFRLYEELTGTAAFDVSRVLHLGVALCVTVGIVRFSRFGTGSGRRDIGRPSHPVECLP